MVFIDFLLGLITINMIKLKSLFSYPLLVGTMLLVSSFNQPKANTAMPPGLYAFSYISNLGLLGEAKPLDWEKPRALDPQKCVRFEVVNDSLIYKHSYDSNGKKLEGKSSTARRTNPKIVAMFKPVPKNYLDYELVGVYSYDHMPTDMWEVLYYSKKRKSLMSVSHSFELNRIDYVILFLDHPHHPFKDFTKFFRVLAGDEAVYHYPVIKQTITINGGNKL